MNANNTTTRRRTATHNGSCQWCGSVQAVHPITGHIAKHGYTVTWGFFQGTCHGSDHQPFEVGTDLLDHSVRMVTEKIERTEATANALRNAGADASTVWVDFYRPATWEVRKDGHVYKEVAVADLRIETSADGRESAYVVNPYTKREMNLTQQIYDRTPWRVVLNTRHAQRLDGEVVRMREYIQWQKARIAAWAPAPLIIRKTR